MTVYNRFLSINPFEDILDNLWSSYHTTIELEEVDNDYVFSVELPGFDRSQIKVSTKNNHLTISAEDEKNKKRTKTIALPKDVNLKKIGAKLKNGILYVSLPKVAAAKPQEILIE